jgi:D-galactarolactone cycloisomerase
MNVSSDRPRGGGAYTSTPDAAARLRIERVETTMLRVPLRKVYSGSQYRMTHRSTLLVRLHTHAGIVGEAYVGDEDATLGEIERIVTEELGPAIHAEDGFAVERLWSVTRPATFDILRDRRLGLVATAGIDAAAWDAVGKLLREPLWRLWGGYRSRIAVITIGGYYAADADIAAEIEDAKARGLAGMKFKVGGLTPEEDAARFREARRAAGADFILMADANQAWTPREAIRFARLVEDCDLYWFEEPCRWHNDRRAMRDVRLAAGVPICAGQSELSAAACRELMEMGAIDVCNFDSSWSGGPTEWRRAAAIAHTYDVSMGHHEEPQIASHLLCSISHGAVLETFHPDRDPIWWNLVANRPKLRDGYVELSEEPGFGWQLDQDYVERYRVPSEE